MPRDKRAYLADVLDACYAIATAVEGLDVVEYQRRRLIRSFRLRLQCAGIPRIIRDAALSIEAILVRTAH